MLEWSLSNDSEEFSGGVSQVMHWTQWRSDSKAAEVAIELCCKHYCDLEDHLDFQRVLSGYKMLGKIAKRFAKQQGWSWT